MTLGEKFPSLLQKPGYEEVAKRPYSTLELPDNPCAAKSRLIEKGRANDLRREIVVAKYDEPGIRWVNDSPIPVCLYDKCPGVEPSEPFVDHVVVRHLPNVGREAGTYLHHICEHYDSLADWTYFTQSGPHNSSWEDFWGRLAVEYTETCSLTERYSDIHPIQEYKDKDTIEWHGGYQVRYGLVDPGVPGWCDAGRLRTKTIWDFYFSCPEPSHGSWTFAYGNQWAVPRQRIADRPLAYWQRLRDAINSSDTSVSREPWSAWCMEMAARYLFGDAAKYPGNMASFKATRKPCRSCGSRSR